MASTFALQPGGFASYTGECPRFVLVYTTPIHNGLNIALGHMVHSRYLFLITLNVCEWKGRPKAVRCLNQSPTV